MKYATSFFSFFGFCDFCLQFFDSRFFSCLLFAVCFLFFQSDIFERQVSAGVFRVGLIENEVFARKDGVEQDAGDGAPR